GDADTAPPPEPSRGGGSPRWASGRAGVARSVLDRTTGPRPSFPARRDRCQTVISAGTNVAKSSSTPGTGIQRRDGDNAGMSDQPVQFTPSGPPETVLPPAPAEAREALEQALALEDRDARREAIAAVVARFPRFLDGWARLGEHA